METTEGRRGMDPWGDGLLSKVAVDQALTQLGDANEKVVGVEPDSMRRLRCSRCRCREQGARFSG
jgi:hypothetical protein